MKPLPEGHGMLLEQPEYFGARCFSDQAVARFPELSAELTRDSGILHVQMTTLASAARRAIVSDDRAFLSRIFDFLEEVLGRQRLHPEVENSIEISFLTPAEFEESDAGKRAWNLLPERLKRVLQRAA